MSGTFEQPIPWSIHLTTYPRIPCALFAISFLIKSLSNSSFRRGIVKILSIVLLIAVGIVLILGIGTLFKGGETSKKYSNKLMQLRVLLQFIAIIALVGFAYFFKD